MKVSAFSCLRIVRVCASSFQLRRSTLPALLCALVVALICPLARAQSVTYSGVERTLYNAPGASPMGVAVDATGAVYIADAANQKVLQLTPSGTGFGVPTILRQASDDGFTPVAVAVDASFNLYIADRVNHRILKENWSGSAYTTETVVTTSLTSPTGIAVDGNQNIYIVDEGAQAILLEEWTPGSPGTYTRIPLQTINGARILDNPIGIAVDSSRNLYITNNDGGNLIQANWLGGALDHYAPSGTSIAGADPGGIAIWPGSSKNLYITGYGSNEHEPLYLETASGSGSPYTYVESDVATTDLAGAPDLERSTGVAIDVYGNIYIADTGHGRVIEEMPGTAANLGAVTVGSASAPVTMLFAFSGESTVTGISPVALTQGAPGLDFAIPESSQLSGTCASNGQIHIYNPSSADSRYLFCSVNVTLTPAFPGARYGAVALQQISGSTTTTVAAAYAYGSGLGPQLVFTNTQSPSPVVTGEITTVQQIASDSAGNLYFSFSGMGVYMLPHGGSLLNPVTTACGQPHAVAVDGAGNVYIADTSRNLILKETLLPNGSYSESQLVTGSLNAPQGVAVDGAGNVYIADTVDNHIVELVALGNGTYATAITLTTTTPLSGPQAVAVDGNGTLYIADTGHNRILKETPSGEGYSESTPVSSLSGPTGVAVDGAGNLFLSAPGYILMELYQGEDSYSQTTLLQSVDMTPTGVAVDGAGDVFYASGGLINQVTMSAPPSLVFAETHVTLSTAAQYVGIANVGTSSLNFLADPTVDGDFSLTGSSCPLVASLGSPVPLSAGGACSYAVVFAPQAFNPPDRSTSMVVTDNNLIPSSSVTQIIQLAGTADAPPEETTTRVWFTPGEVMDAGQTVTIHVRVTGSVTPVGMVAITDTYGDDVTVTITNCGELNEDGTYSISYNPATVGRHTISVTYTPSDPTSYITSSHSGRLIVLNAGTTFTTLTVGTAITPGTEVTTVPSGTAITLTARVVAGSTLLTPGVVNFCEDVAESPCTDVHLLGTAQLTSAGTASITLTPGHGPHSYKAIFLGGSNDQSSISRVRELEVPGILPYLSPYPTTTTITSSTTSPGTYALTATVAGMGSMTHPLTGTVSFLDSSNNSWMLGTTASTLNPSILALDFENPSSPAGGNSAVAVGDFNGDGKLDMAVTNTTNATLYIYLGNGDGTFTVPEGSPISIGNGPQSIVAGDFNNDGKLDLATANYVDHTVTVLLGNGDGTFTVVEGEPPATGRAPTAIVTGDFNGDGNADLAVANSVDNTVTILLGNGSGVFTAGSTTGTGANPVSLAVGDFNNDGHLDLATANYTDRTVTVLLNSGPGTFSAAVGPATGRGPSSIATADLRRNGTLDLVVANSIDNTVTVLLNNGEGTGTFTVVDAPPPATGNNPRGIAIADFNHDGVVDLAVSNTNDDTVTVLTGNRDGTFTATATSPSTGPANSAPQGIAIGKFTGGDLPDVAATNANTATTAVLVLHPELSTETATVTVSGIPVIGTGTHNIVASYSGETEDGPLYSPSTSNPIALTAEPKTTTLTLSALPGSSTYGQSVTLTATLCPFTGAGNSSNGESVNFYQGGTLIGSGILSNGVATLTLSTLPAGNPTLTASYAIQDSYLAASLSTGLSFPVAAATPTITFTVANWGFGAAPFPVSASSASSGAFTYALVSGPATVTGNMVTLTGAGTVVLSATQAATSNYTSASQNTSFTVTPTPTITFSVPNQTFGAAPFTVSASSASSGAFTYALVSGPATITGNTVTVTGAGTVVLSANQAAAGNYAAGSQDASFTVGAETPTIAFAVADQTYGAAPFTVSASSASSGAFTYALVSGPATVTGNTVTVTGAGTVVLSASQAAAGNYATGTQNTSFTVAPETPLLTFATIAVQTTNSVPFSVSASSPSAGAITYAVVSGPATIVGSTVTLTGTGTVVLSAAQAAAGNYTAAFTTTSFLVDSGFTLGLASGPSSTAGSATTTPGGAATFGLTLSPGTGTTFPDAVTFTAFGLPTGATATFSPATIPAGSGPTTVTLTIQTASTQAAMGERPFPVDPLGPLALGLLLPLVGVRRAQRWMRQLRYSALAALALLGVMAALGGCAGTPAAPAAQNTNTTTQSYAVVVTATDTVTGARTTANVNLTVQ